MILLRAVDGVLATFAQLLFSRSRVVGAALLAACATDPRALGFGLLAVASTAVATRGLGLGEEVTSSGPYGYNALLVGLGLAHAYVFGVTSAVLVVFGAIVCVLVSAAFVSTAHRVGAPPVLTLPFVATWWLLLGVPQAFGLSAVHPVASGSSSIPIAALEGLGSLLFLPRADAGALVLVALVLHSRIAALLAVSAAGLVFLLGRVSPALLDAPLVHALVLNASFAAIALGGVFFVPSAASFGLAMVGALGAVTFALGSAGLLGRLGLPALILPFNASVLLVLFAMRQRVFDRLPKSVDFVPGTPEENLAYFQSRLARFQALYAVAFHLPFRGAWTCTQGVDGKLTHQGAWRHGFDFEVRGDDGQLFRGEGATVDEHHCHRLPVLAAADGVVVKVVNDVADNAIGAQDLKRNWGNVVVVCHAPGLYSLVAHLSQGSARVYEGQGVRRGDVLGLCGSSGRSPRPHLHFQLQASPQLGAPTLPCRFSDVVAMTRREELRLAATPCEGETVRNVAPDDELASFFRFEPGAVLVFQDHHGAAEHIEHEIDLLGNLVLRSRQRGATLHFARTDDGFTAYDPLGSSRSVLHLLRAALPRAPFDDAVGLVWTDYLPARALGSGLLRELLAPLFPGFTLDYRLEHFGERLVVRGASRKTRSDGTPQVTTTATLTRARGLIALEVVTGSTRHTATRLEDTTKPPTWLPLYAQTASSRSGESQ